MTAAAPKPSGNAAAVAVAAAIVTMISIALPWMTAGLGSDPTTYSGLRFLPAAIPLLLAALATAALAIGSVRGRPDLASAAVVASGGATALVAVMIAVTETATLLIPTSLLPATIRRTTLVLGAGSGIWLALLSMSIAAVAMSGWKPHSIIWSERLTREGRTRMLALLALLAFTALIAWLRYRAWIDMSALDQHLSLPGWAAPWIGPSSLFAVGMLVGALVLAAVSSARIAGLVAAAAGWLTSFLAALAVVAVSSIGRLGLDDLLPHTIDQNAPTFHTTLFVWMTFLAGLAVAGIGAFLVYWPDQLEGEEAPWRRL